MDGEIRSVNQGTLVLPKLDGYEARNSRGMSARLIGEPTPIPGTNKLRALAEVEGCLCLVELALNFVEPKAPA